MGIKRSHLISFTIMHSYKTNTLSFIIRDYQQSSHHSTFNTMKYGLKSKQKVVGYSRDDHDTIIPVSMSYQASNY